MTAATRLVLALAALLLQPQLARAADLVVEVNGTDLAGPTPTMRVRIAWDNAWQNDRNHDAAWVTVRYSVPRWGATPHLQIASARVVETIEGPEVSVIVPDDGVGVFVATGGKDGYRGPIACVVELTLRSGPNPRAGEPEELDYHAFGVEMVAIPAGSFLVGGTAPDAPAHAAFYKINEDGGHGGLFEIADESPITVGDVPGELWWDHSGARQYEGDRQGPVPGAFPKGTRAFFCMKYELTQGQYADFLNALPEAAANFRAPIGGREYTTYRGSIELADGRYVARSPDRPMNYVSWDDGCAWADWMGLRPMTELEFTKAARGPVQPVARDYPWGTADKADLLRVVAPDDDLVTSGDADESGLSDANRGVYGASYYWVMDLAGSVWERCVTIGHPAGRAFTGADGDGTTTGYGFANVKGWPARDDRRLEGSGGYGYRGGGYYTHEQEYVEGGFNPHSPVAFRTYGSWGEAPRSKAYGFRAVRTAPAAE